jgi:hypothetical protein
VDAINSIRHEQNVMSKIHTTLHAAGLKLPLQISLTDHEDSANIPWISLSTWVEFLIKADKLCHLFGGLPLAEIGGVLTRFWELYRRLEPDLTIYELFDAGGADPASTIPMTSHADEGRGIFDFLQLHITVSLLFS